MGARNNRVRMAEDRGDHLAVGAFDIHKPGIWRLDQALLLVLLKLRGRRWVKQVND